MAYDVTDDRRRSDLYHWLLAFGTPVQYSVFECWLSEMELERMYAGIRERVKLREDTVLIYGLCAECEEKIRRLGVRKGELESEGVVVIV